MDHQFYRELTQAELARIFDVPKPKVQQWVDGGCPFAMQGRRKVLDAALVKDWLIEQSTKKKATTTRKKDPDDDLMDPEMFDDNLDKYRHYKAEQAKLALEKEKGRLISREAHEDFVRRAGDYVRGGFQALPKKLAVKLAKERDSVSIEKLLEEEIIDTLLRLSKLELQDV